MSGDIRPLSSKLALDLRHPIAWNGRKHGVEGLMALRGGSKLAGSAICDVSVRMRSGIGIPLNARKTFQNVNNLFLSGFKT